MYGPSTVRYFDNVLPQRSALLQLRECTASTPEQPYGGGNNRNDRGDDANIVSGARPSPSLTREQEALVVALDSLGSLSPHEHMKPNSRA